MSGRGRKPLPTDIKKNRGTLQPCRENSSEPKPNRATKDMAPPDHLTARGKRMFNEFKSLLIDMNVLTNVDRKALEMLVDAYDQYREARDFLAENGLTYKSSGRSGTQIKPYPEVAVRSDSWKRFVNLLVQFGLTPSSRSGVNANTAATKEDDALSELIKEANSE